MSMLTTWGLGRRLWLRAVVWSMQCTAEPVQSAAPRVTEASESRSRSEIVLRRVDGHVLGGQHGGRVTGSRCLCRKMARRMQPSGSQCKSRVRCISHARIGLRSRCSRPVISIAAKLKVGRAQLFPATRSVSAPPLLHRTHLPSTQ